MNGFIWCNILADYLSLIYVMFTRGINLHLLDSVHIRFRVKCSKFHPQITDQDHRGVYESTRMNELGEGFGFACGSVVTKLIPA